VIPLGVLDARRSLGRPDFATSTALSTLDVSGHSEVGKSRRGIRRVVLAGVG
jgi:hypothetical protein